MRVITAILVFSFVIFYFLSSSFINNRLHRVNEKPLVLNKEYILRAFGVVV